MNDDAERIEAEWKSERLKHPIFGENLSKEAVDKIWDESAKTYSDAGYSRIADAIVEKMLDDGILDSMPSLIDIGSGPGTFAKRFSPYCGSIVCADGSRPMLDRVESLGLSNVRTLESDCFGIPDEFRSDVSFCSLCPPMNCPEGLRTMERLSEGWCVYVSSANRESGIEGRIWNALGKDYTYAGYDTMHPYRILKAWGREPAISFFEQPFESGKPVEDFYGSMVKRISSYVTLDDDSKRIVRDAVEDFAEDGFVRQSGSLRIGMLAWMRRQPYYRIPRSTRRDSEWTKYLKQSSCSGAASCALRRCSQHSPRSSASARNGPSA